MSGDLNQIVRKLEAISVVKPIPGVDFVRAYINAYYLSQKELMKWVFTHPEYSKEQVVAVAKVGVVGSKLNFLKMPELVTQVTAEWEKGQRNV